MPSVLRDSNKAKMWWCARFRKISTTLRIVHMVLFRLRFIYRNQWDAWNLLSLSQLHHVNTYIESNTTHLLQMQSSM